MKKILFLLLILLCLGCSKKIKSDIVSFSYNVDGGLGGFCNYKIEIKDEKTIYNKECMGLVEANINKEIDGKYLDEIKKIINDNKIYEWNGFNKINKYVLDGAGFTLDVHYSNNQVIKAHGYAIFPKNYNEVAGILRDYLDNIN